MYDQEQTLNVKILATKSHYFLGPNLDPCWSWLNSTMWLARSRSWRLGKRLLRKSSSKRERPVHLSRLRLRFSGGNKDEGPPELNIPLVEPLRNFASAPGAAEMTRLPDMRAPRGRDVEVLLRLGGGVRLPEVSPMGPGDAVTVPRAP